MAELVGGALLSSFLNVLFDRMATVLDFVSGKKNDNGLLMRELKIKLLTANKLVDDAEEKQMTSPTVRKWLDDLKEAIYCVGELLDEINAEALRRQLEGDDDHSPAASSSTSWISRSESKPSSVRNGMFVSGRGFAARHSHSSLHQLSSKSYNHPRQGFETTHLS